METCAEPAIAIAPAIEAVSPQAMLTALEVTQRVPLEQAENLVRFARYADPAPEIDIPSLVNAIPTSMAAALARKVYYFVPLAVPDTEGDGLRIAHHVTEDLADRASCHRNLVTGESDLVFISAGIMADRFALAFELFINVGHGMVDQVGVSAGFAEVAWRQAEQAVRGETSQDALEARTHARPATGDAAIVDEKAKKEFLEAAFADAIAVYLLSLVVDVDYYELREREYPLLEPRALAERLRTVADLFPPNDGYTFSIRYRRRG